MLKGEAFSGCREGIEGVLSLPRVSGNGHAFQQRLWKLSGFSRNLENQSVIGQVLGELST